MDGCGLIGDTSTGGLEMMQDRSAKQPRRVRVTSGLALTLCVCCASSMHATVLPTATVLQSTGDKANRVDLLFVGDGYTAEELPTTYADHIDHVIAQMYNTGGINAGTTNPYARYQNYFNIIRTDIASNESGVDRFGENEQVIELVDTALSGRLGATYQGIYYAQSLRIDHTGAVPYFLNQALPAISYTLDDMDWQFAAVNTTLYGGEASSYAAFTAGNINAAELALHEGGHWNHDLGDEYGGVDANFPYSPVEVNLSSSATGDDWSHWLGYLDPQTGVVDAFPGGRGFDTGVYHPSADSKMQSLNIAFDPIAREKIILDIYAIVDPIDSHLDTAQTYGLNDELWIEVIDPAVVLVQWLIDGQIIAAQTQETLDLSEVVSALGPGEHTLTARAYDAILDHNFSDNNNPDPLDLVRRDLDQLEQSVSFNIDIAWLPGDTDLDGDVDEDDLNTILQAFGDSVSAGDASSGDVTGDGEVSIADLDTALAYWTGAGQALSVPEPVAALPLLALSLLPRRRAPTTIDRPSLSKAKARTRHERIPCCTSPSINRSSLRTSATSPAPVSA